MASFECNGCGKCCQSYGAFIRIERQVTEKDYFCHNGITGEHFQVHVQPEFAEEIGDEYEESDEGKKPTNGRGCPFLCRNPDGRFACAVHPTRPAICRDFRCYRMLIRHAETGEIRGKIIGDCQLSTRDENLLALWNEKIASLRTVQEHGPALPAPAPDTRFHTRMQGSGHGNDREWMAQVTAILASHGYSGDPVE